jgi:peroxiredoxin
MFGRRKSKQLGAATMRLLAINPRAGEPLELRVLKSTVSIGSDEANDFVIRQPTVSQRHAILVQRADHFELSDLVSTNGTFVNGRRVYNVGAVTIGDELRFGGVRFVLAKPAAIGDGVAAVFEPPQTRRKTFSSRAALELALLTLAIGFGSAQYLAYLVYHEQNRLILAAAVPLPPSQVHPLTRAAQSEASSATPIAPPRQIAKRDEPGATLPRARSSVSRVAGVASPTAELPSMVAPAPVSREPDELAGAVSLMRLFPGSATHAGEPAGEFQLSDLGGMPVSLAAMRGKVVLLTFWATWCGACRGELPNLQNLYRTLKDHHDFEVLTVNIDQTPAPVLPFVRKNDYQFPVLLDSDNRVSSAYDVRGIPANFIIDRTGKIIWNCAGSVDWSDPLLQKAVKKLL